MYNHVVLIGRLTADPELRYTPSGTPVANFRLAVDRASSKSGGERQTDFINVVAWQRTAEFAANYLTKGRLVVVDGRLQIRQWTTPEGLRRQAAEVVSNRLQPLDRRRDEAGGTAEETESGEPPEVKEPGDAGMEETPDPWEDQ